MEENIRGEFIPTKVIILSELPTREKEKYYQLLANSNSKFRKDSEGRYIANVRLLAPNVKKIENNGRKKDLSNYSLVFQERLRKLKEEGFINVRIVGVAPFDYNSFPRFTALIAFNGDTIRPKPKPLSWVMKIVEDIYDHRFAHEKNDVEREEDSPSFDLMLLIFPVFVVRRLGTNVGLKALVDQTCWDLAYNTHIYRRDYLELEVFGRFLQEFYDHDDLLFYLYVRSVIAKVLHINFKTRWTKSDGPGRQPKSLWMSFRECSHVARIVFGTDNEDLYRNFMSLITPQMVGQLTASSDSRRMDITEYLHLSVVGYHQSQSHSSQSQSGERLLVPLPGQIIPSIPVPNPDVEASYLDDSAFRSGHNDDTAAAAAAAADRHAAGRRFTKQHQHQQHHEEQAYELEEDREYEPQGLVGNRQSSSEYYDVDPYHHDDEGQHSYSYDEDGVGMDSAEAAHLHSAGPDTQPYLHDVPNYSALDLEGAAELQPQYEQHEQHNDSALLSEGEPNEFETLQLQREREFIVYLCEPLSEQVPEEYAQHIEADLSERLRQTVNIFLSDKHIEDIDGLDNYLVEFLSLEQLRLDMEATRDELVAHLMADHIRYDEQEQQQDAAPYEQYGEYGNKGEDERKHAADKYAVGEV